MVILIRALAVLLAVLVVLWVLQRLVLRAGPRFRYLLSGVGLNLLRLLLARRLLPLLLRAVRSLFFFR